MADNDERLNENKESYIEFSKAKKEAPDVEIGDELTYECSLEKFRKNSCKYFT